MFRWGFRVFQERRTKIHSATEYTVQERHPRLFRKLHRKEGGKMEHEQFEKTVKEIDIAVLVKERS